MGEVAQSGRAGSRGPCALVQIQPFPLSRWGITVERHPKKSTTGLKNIVEDGAVAQSGRAIG